ncbi:RraA family protein [Bacillus dakarensis]|uniref:RraA family protein n=1 Tax=Robertmurraya dakarensis TaxID=1926278 RepID=UPI0009825B3D|nr:RraA family protein [Bacillus dakarensis]
MPKVGYRIIEEIERADLELVNKFRGMPTSIIADNMGRFYAMDSELTPYNQFNLVGTAVTVKSNTADNLFFHKALDLAKPGDVIVVDVQGDCTNAVCGEVMVRYAMKKKIAGFVVDGAIRDVDSIRELDFSVFAKGVSPRGPHKTGPGEINVPISCGGVIVNPGDIIVGDQDGIAVVPKELAEELFQKSIETVNKEVKIFEDIEKECLDRSWIDETLRSIGCQVPSK